MGVNLSTDYLHALETMNTIQTGNMQQNMQALSALPAVDTSQNKDSYVSTVGTTQEAMPSETYGYIMEMIRAGKQTAGEEASAPTDEDFQEMIEQLKEAQESASSATATQETETASDTAATETASTGTATASTTGADATTTQTSAADSSSGTSSDSSSNSSGTTVEILIGQDGSIYEKTTTTDADGKETVTITKIADAPKGQTDGNQPMMPPPPKGEMNEDQMADALTALQENEEVS
jgi:hypothetical protein